MSSRLYRGRLWRGRLFAGRLFHGRLIDLRADKTEAFYRLDRTVSITVKDSAKRTLSRKVHEIGIGESFDFHALFAGMIYGTTLSSVVSVTQHSGPGTLTLGSGSINASALDVEGTVQTAKSVVTFHVEAEDGVATAGAYMVRVVAATEDGQHKVIDCQLRVPDEASTDFNQTQSKNVNYMVDPEKIRFSALFANLIYGTVIDEAEPITVEQVSGEGVLVVSNVIMNARDTVDVEGEVQRVGTVVQFDVAADGGPEPGDYLLRVSVTTEDSQTKRMDCRIHVGE